MHAEPAYTAQQETQGLLKAPWIELIQPKEPVIHISSTPMGQFQDPSEVKT